MRPKPGCHLALCVSGVLDSLMAPHQFHIGIRLLWSKVCGKGVRRPPSASPQRKLQNKWDWEGKKYISLTFDWDYINRQVHVSMRGYVNMSLIRFKHKTPKRKQDQPYQHVIPNYGAKTQYAVGPDGTALLDKDRKKFVQQVTGTFLYYAQAVDSTMLVALSALESE